MEANHDHYLKRSAFQAVYLITFILASFSLVGSLYPTVNTVVEVFAKKGGVNHAVIASLLYCLLVVVLVHWLRLYITLEQLEDDLHSGNSIWFKGWRQPLRFLEFLARSLFVAWMGLKVVTGTKTGSDLDRLNSFFAFLFGLYALMVLWGFIYLIGERASLKWQRPRGFGPWFKFLGIDSFLVLSLPAAIAFYLLPRNILATDSDNHLVLAAFLVFVIGFMALHLIYDATSKSTKDERSVGSWKDCRFWKYVQWIRDRVAGDEPGFCLFFLAGLALLRLSTIESGVGTSVASFMALVVVDQQTFARSFGGVAVVVLACCTASAVYSWWVEDRTLLGGLTPASALITFGLAYSVSVGPTEGACNFSLCELLTPWDWMAFAATLAVSRLIAVACRQENEVEGATPDAVPQGTESASTSTERIQLIQKEDGS